jgi:hypothetical protein
MSLNSNFRIHSHIDKKDFPNGINAFLIFAAISLNSNFRIHSHIDKKDFPNGITCLLNVHRTNAEAGQLHVLVDYSLEEAKSWEWLSFFSFSK